MVGEDIPELRSAGSRRVFVQKGDQACQVATFTQSTDASVYVFLPRFSSAQWRVLLPHVLGDVGELPVFELGEEGKLSVHGTGQAHIRPAGPGSAMLINQGNALVAADGSALNARHLVTLFFAEPRHLPVSPAGNRPTDVVLRSTVELEPFVLLVWAVPSQGLEVAVQFSLSMDDIVDASKLERTVLGYGLFALRRHTVLWYAYRTVHMDRWPSETQALFTDGFVVPVLIGVGAGRLKCDFRRPSYALEGRRLSIAL